MDTHKTCIARSFDTPSIMTLGRNDETRKGYILSVKMMLVKLDQLLNVKGFVPVQIDAIPTMLLNPEFQELRLNDINLICNYIATARYPKEGLFAKMDVNTFFICVREYMADDERISARESHHRQLHLNKTEAVESFKHLPQETQDLFCKRQEAKIMLTPNDVPPMLFKTTDKQAMKKLKGERHD